MNWIKIGLAMLSGGLAGVIATLLLRKLQNPKARRIVVPLAFLISFGAIQGFFQEYISPKFNNWNNARKAESALNDSPLFQAIKQYEPNTYDHMLSTLKNELGKGVDNSQVIGHMRQHISEIAYKRIPYASDQAVASYGKAMLAEMNELNSRGGDFCFKVISSQQSGRTDNEIYFSKETGDADLAALAQVIRTSAENPQSVPREEDVMPMVTPIYLELQKEYGNDLLMLQNLNAPNVDKTKVCSIVIGLFTKILQLPENKSGKILRFLFLRGLAN